MERRLVARADLVIAASEELAARFPAAKTHLVPMASISACSDRAPRAPLTCRRGRWRLLWQRFRLAGPAHAGAGGGRDARLALRLHRAGAHGTFPRLRIGECVLPRPTAPRGAALLCAALDGVADSVPRHAPDPRLAIPEAARILASGTTAAATAFPRSRPMRVWWRPSIPARAGPGDPRRRRASTPRATRRRGGRRWDRRAQAVEAVLAACEAPEPAPISLYRRQIGSRILFQLGALSPYWPRRAPWW